MPNDQNIPIASEDAVYSRVASLNSRSDDIKGRLAEVLADLWNPVRTLKGVDPEIGLEYLIPIYPQFKNVIESIENSVFVSSLVQGPFRMGPILLVGEPGLGKTYFVKNLAERLGLPYFEISFATITASFALTGGSLQWSEGTVGELAKIISKSEVANPIVLLDEVDKCNEDTRYNPINVLYSLLEPHTARRFKDEALEIELDLSHVNWVCTANYPKQIPDPILSRMNIFEIVQPAPLRMQRVVEHMYSHFRNTYAHGQLMSETIDDRVLEALSMMSPRSIRIQLEQASLKTLRRGSRQISMNDLTPQSVQEVHRVGFI